MLPIDADSYSVTGSIYRLNVSKTHSPTMSSLTVSKTLQTVIRKTKNQYGRNGVERGKG